MNKRTKNKKYKQNWIDNKLKKRPNSELWFNEQLKINDVRMPFIENKMFGGYCPDYRNEQYKVIVEVDGTIHKLDNVIKRDIKKDKKFKDLGYQVIRVIAYDTDSLNSCIDILKKLRLSKPLDLSS
jgi:very-short-patch-repair endonuclease